MAQDGTHQLTYWDVATTTDPKQYSDKGGQQDFEMLFFEFDRYGPGGHNR